MKYLIIFLFSISCFASNNDDPEFEDTVFVNVCEEKLIQDLTKQALFMPSGMQSEMNRSWQRQKKTSGNARSS